MATTAREVLNELRWREPSRIQDAVIVYRDRTRPDGFRTIRGSEIVELGRRYFTAGGDRLPYYKIERIEAESRIVFRRPSPLRPSTTASTASPQRGPRQ